MKTPDEYLKDATARREPLRALIEKVQREAFEAGFTTAGNQLFAIADAAKTRSDHVVNHALANGLAH